jgi:hypothetical protein
MYVSCKIHASASFIHYIGGYVGPKNYTVCKEWKNTCTFTKYLSFSTESFFVSGNEVFKTYLDLRRIKLLKNIQVLLHAKGCFTD